MTARPTTSSSAAPTETTHVAVAGAAGDVSVSGLAATVELLHAEAADQLDFETLAGSDTVSSGGLAAGTIQLFVDGALVP